MFIDSCYSYKGVIGKTKGQMNHPVPSLGFRMCTRVEPVSFFLRLKHLCFIPPLNLTSNLEFHFLVIFSSAESGVKF